MKQQLSEALVDLNNWAVLSNSQRRREAEEVAFAAARLVERLLPGECGSCPPMNHQLPPNERPFCICATCHGSGRVWDEGIVEAVAKALAEYRYFVDSEVYRVMARAVLSALVELLTEKVET